MTNKISFFSRAIVLAVIVAVVLVPSSASAFATPRRRTVSCTPQRGTSHQQLLLSPRLRNNSSIRKDAPPTALAYTVSPEPIHTAFNVATFGPQIFWLFMIVLPNTKFTKKVMGGFEIVLLFCLVHFFIVSGSIVTGGSGATAPLAEFNDVFDPAGDPQNAFIGMVTKYPNFVAEEWSHVLTWDLLVGRFIWLDGIKRGIFTSHSVLLTNLIGPPGLLLHWLTCLVTGNELWEKDPALETKDEN